MNLESSPNLYVRQFLIEKLTLAQKISWMLEQSILKELENVINMEDIIRITNNLRDAKNKLKK